MFTLCQQAQHEMFIIEAAVVAYDKISCASLKDGNKTRK